MKKTFKPNITKFKKYHKGRISLAATVNYNNTILRHGDYGLRVREASRLTPKHLETLRRTIKRVIRRTGRIWINSFAHLPVSAKPNENRMGKGKGKTKYYSSLVRPGDIVLEIGGNVIRKIAKKALVLASRKLPVKSYLVIRE